MRIDAENVPENSTPSTGYPGLEKRETSSSLTVPSIRRVLVWFQPYTRLATCATLAWLFSYLSDTRAIRVTDFSATSVFQPMQAPGLRSVVSVEPRSTTTVCDLKAMFLGCQCPPLEIENITSASYPLHRKDFDLVRPKLYQHTSHISAYTINIRVNETLSNHP